MSQAEVKEEVNGDESESEEEILTVKFKPGQKHQTPSPGSGDRVFYDTLYEQNPDSHMAQEWCVAYGTLPVLEADRLHRIICKRKNIVVKSSPVKKSQSSSKSKNGSSSNGSAKKKAKTSAVVSDTGLDAGGVWEGVGAKEM